MPICASTEGKGTGGRPRGHRGEGQILIDGKALND